MLGNIRAAVSLSCFLLAFEFGSRSEPEFVASTIRPARMVPQLIGLFADHLFICVHVMFPKDSARLYVEISCLFLNISVAANYRRDVILRRFCTLMFS